MLSVKTSSDVNIDDEYVVSVKYNVDNSSDSVVEDGVDDIGGNGPGTAQTSSDAMRPLQKC